MATRKKATKKRASKRKASKRRPGKGTPRRPKSGPGDLLSIRAYAASRKERGLPGTSHTAVRKAIETGRIARAVRQGVDGKPKIDPAIADVAWLEQTDSNQQRESAAKTPRQAELFENPADAVKRASATASIATHRATKEDYAARRAELEWRKLEGELVVGAETWEEVFRLFRVVRDRAFGIGPRLSAALAAETDAFEIEQQLEREFRSLFEGLADGFTGENSSS